MSLWHLLLLAIALVGPATAVELTADLDGDGASGPAMGWGVSSGGMVHINRAHAGDAYTHLWTTDFFINGNVIDLCVGPTNMYGYPTLICASFEGQIDLIGFNGESFVRHAELGSPLQIDYPPRSMRMYAGAGISNATEEWTTRGPRLWIAGANPHAGEMAFGYDALGPVGLTLHVPDGRIVRRLGLNAGWGHARWDGSDARGERLPAGTYYCRVSAGGRAAIMPVVRLRQRRMV